MDWLTNPEIWVSLLTLTVLEIILGIDNIVFISILAGKLPPQQHAKARQTGLSLAAHYASFSPLRTRLDVETHRAVVLGSCAK